MKLSKIESQDFKVADIYLSNFGFKEILLAEKEMPGLMLLKERLSDKKPLRGLLKILKPNGRLFIFNHFNKYNIDVFIKYRTRSKNDNILQSGWNIHSIKGLEEFFKTHGKKTKVFKFKPKKSFKVKSNDPLRSWTFKNKKNENLITNGLSILQEQYWLKFY